MFLIVIRLFGVLCAGRIAAQTADLVVENAIVYTVDPARPKASALAVKDGKFLAVGTDMKKHIGPSTRRIDAKGAAVIPGLIDSHVHMRSLGDMLETMDLRGVSSIEEIAKRVAAKAASLPKGTWIRGRNWDQTNWGGKFPVAADLDKVSPDHPVYLTRVDGHAGWGNSLALTAGGVTKSTEDPKGGQIIRDAAGVPTGILVDRAQALVSRKIPPLTEDQIEARLARAAQECARLGMTTVHDAGISRQELEAYRRLIAKGKLPVRIYAMIGGAGDLWQDYLQRGPEIGDRLTVRSIKLVADGAMGSRGAAFFQPYSDDKQNSGLLILQKEYIRDVAKDAVAKGFQVNTHAIGDRANRTVLDAYGEALEGRKDRRFRVEHAQVVSLPDFKLYADYAVIASLQSTHATSDMRWAKDRLGPDRLLGAWAPRRFLNAGVRITNGSDFPVEDPNPFWGLYSAITRMDHQGNPPGGFMPDQKLNREETLKSWTLDGAYAAFEESKKGSITPGKLADFLILTKDVMTVEPKEILTTLPATTYLGGEAVFKNGSN
ncbi:MAG: amidohydrolase [Bryobacteraceae bacterium]|nr:amidohydrolase [Bryobacteraceae bacterium]